MIINERGLQAIVADAIQADMLERWKEHKQQLDWQFMSYKSDLDRQFEGGTYAIQEQSPTAVSVCQAPEDRETLRSTYTEYEDVARAERFEWKEGEKHWQKVRLVDLVQKPTLAAILWPGASGCPPSNSACPNRRNTGLTISRTLGTR